VIRCFVDGAFNITYTRISLKLNNCLSICHEYGEPMFVIVLNALHGVH